MLAIIPDQEDMKFYTIVSIYPKCIICGEIEHVEVSKQMATYEWKNYICDLCG